MEESKLTGKKENNIPMENSANLKTSVFYNFDYSTNKFSFLSNSVEGLTGYSLKELNKVNFSDLIVEGQEVITKVLNKVNDGNLKEDIVKYSIKTKSGEEKLVEDSFLIWE